MYQKLLIAGNLGADPTLRFTPSGVPVCSFNVATNRRWTDDKGEQHEKVVWFRVSAWRKLGEICNQYLSKGRQVFIEGELEADPQTGGPRLWDDKEGNKRASFEVTALTVKFLGGGSGKPSEAMGGESSESNGTPAVSDDSVPF